MTSYGGILVVRCVPWMHALWGWYRRSRSSGGLCRRQRGASITALGCTPNQERCAEAPSRRGSKETGGKLNDRTEDGDH